MSSSDNKSLFEDFSLPLKAREVLPKFLGNIEVGFASRVFVSIIDGGEVLRRRISAKGFTRESLASRVGLEGSHLSSFLSGKKGIRLDAWEKMLDILGRDLEQKVKTEIDESLVITKGREEIYRAMVEKGVSLTRLASELGVQHQRVTYALRLVGALTHEVACRLMNLPVEKVEPEKVKLALAVAVEAERVIKAAEAGKSVEAKDVKARTCPREGDWKVMGAVVRMEGGVARRIDAAWGSVEVNIKPEAYYTPINDEAVAEVAMKLSELYGLRSAAAKMAGLEPLHHFLEKRGALSGDTILRVAALAGSVEKAKKVAAVIPATGIRSFQPRLVGEVEAEQPRVGRKPSLAPDWKGEKGITPYSLALLAKRLEGVEGSAAEHLRRIAEEPGEEAEAASLLLKVISLTPELPVRVLLSALGKLRDGLLEREVPVPTSLHEKVKLRDIAQFLSDLKKMMEDVGGIKPDSGKAGVSPESKAEAPSEEKLKNLFQYRTSLSRDVYQALAKEIGIPDKVEVVFEGDRVYIERGWEKIRERMNELGLGTSSLADRLREKYGVKIEGGTLKRVLREADVLLVDAALKLMGMNRIRIPEETVALNAMMALEAARREHNLAVSEGWPADGDLHLLCAKVKMKGGYVVEVETPWGKFENVKIHPQADYKLSDKYKQLLMDVVKKAGSGYESKLWEAAGVDALRYFAERKENVRGDNVVKLAILVSAVNPKEAGEMLASAVRVGTTR